MIVIGLDVHKQSVTAVAVDEAGRPLDGEADPGRQRRAARLGGRARRRAAVGGRGLPAAHPLARTAATQRRRRRGAGAAEADRAGTACRQDTRQVGPDRCARRSPAPRSARPDLSRPRPDERVYREIKLLVDHRDDLVDQRRRTQQRLRWHLLQLDPTFQVPLRMLGRSSHLERVAPLACPPRPRAAGAARARTRQTLPAAQPTDRGARPGTRTTSQRHRAGAARAARLRRRHRREAARRDRPRRPLPLRRAARPPQRRRTARSKLRHAASATGSTAAATANSTPPSTESRSPRPATTRRHANTSNANEPRARADAKRSAASNDSSSASSSTHSKRARLDIGATLAQVMVVAPETSLAGNSLSCL